MENALNCAKVLFEMPLFNQVSILRHHIYKVTDYGADFHELCRLMKLTPEQLHDGEAQLEWKPDPEGDFWTHALALTGDPCLGLHLGELPDKHNSFGMLELLAKSCRNAREALEMVTRYSDTISTVFKYELDVSGKEAIFSFRPHTLWEEVNLESARQAVDMTISQWIRNIQEVCVSRIYPLRTEIKYSKRFVDEYQRILKGPILFDKPDNCFVFSKQDLETPLINYDQSLMATFDHVLTQKKNRLDNEHTTASKVKHLLVSQFHGQITHIDIVASCLHMTTRTLQRKLSEENTSYRVLCNEMRKELTTDLMKSGKSKKNKIARILGYSDTSSLTKAIKNWTEERE